MDLQLNKINLISLNVNGLQNKAKRYKITLKCDIALLQETHLNSVESEKLRQRWVGQVFSSPGKMASRGVSILLSKSTPFKASSVHSDSDGRYIIVSGVLCSDKITLVNIYAPNSQQATFLASLSPVISRVMEGPLVIGGDVNAVCDPSLDRSRAALPSDRHSSAALSEFQSHLAVTDIWRLINPEAREYSFYSGAHNTYSRIDCIMMSSNLIQNVIDVKINSIVVSDHAAISVSFFPKASPLKSSQWRLNTSILKNDKLVSKVENLITEFLILT